MQASVEITVGKLCRSMQLPLNSWDTQSGKARNESMGSMKGNIMFWAWEGEGAYLSLVSAGRKYNVLTSSPWEGKKISSWLGLGLGAKENPFYPFLIPKKNLSFNDLQFSLPLLEPHGALIRIDKLAANCILDYLPPLRSLSQCIA